MSKREELLALAERVEAAGPDRESDGLIHCALHPRETTVVGHEPGRFPRKAVFGPISAVMERIGGKDGADYLSAAPYTASLDAAMTVPPEGAASECMNEAVEALGVTGWTGRWRDALPRFVTAAGLRARAAMETEG